MLIKVHANNVIMLTTKQISPDILYFTAEISSIITELLEHLF